MSSWKRDWYNSFNQSTLHPILALFIPFFFFVALTEILDTVFSGLFGASLLLYILLLLAGLEEVVVGNILYRERVGGAERLREFIYLTIVLFGVLLMMPRGGLRERLIALQNPRYIYIGLSVLLEWLLAARIHTSLRQREILLKALKDKRGERLKLSLRGSAETATLSLVSLKKVKRIIVLLQLLIFTSLVLLYVFGISLSPFLLVACMLHGIVGILFVFILNTAIQDQLLFGQGVFPDSPFQRRRFGVALLLLAIVIVLVLSIARNSSLLPLSLFGPFLDWLFGLFSAKPRAGYSPPIMRQNPMRRDLTRLLAHLNQEPSPFMELIKIVLAVLGRIILMSLVILFIYFLLSPLLSEYFRTIFRRLHPLRVLQRKLWALAAYLREVLGNWLAWLRGSNPRRRISVDMRDETDRWKRLRLKRRRLLKRLEISRFLRIFLRLTRWAKARGTEYRRVLAPVEYGFIVSEAVPLVKDALIESMRILEEALYSPRVLSSERSRRYVYLVKTIIRQKTV